MDMTKKNDDFLVCACKKISKGEIMNVIREKKITDVQLLREMTGAGATCGACMEDLQQLIDMVKAE